MAGNYTNDTPEDWRLSNQWQYLYDARLTLQPYKKWNQNWDHDLCEFCHKKFVEDALADPVVYGYASEDKHHWVCEKCYGDFRRLFEWEGE